MFFCMWCHDELLLILVATAFCPASNEHNNNNSMVSRDLSQAEVGSKVSSWCTYINTVTIPCFAYCRLSWWCLMGLDRLLIDGSNNWCVEWRRWRARAARLDNMLLLLLVACVSMCCCFAAACASNVILNNSLLIVTWSLCPFLFVFLDPFVLPVRFA